MPDDLEHEDRAIERAAIALAWEARQTPIGGTGGLTSSDWWNMQTEMDRRLYRRRARVVVTEWEAAHAA